MKRIIVAALIAFTACYGTQDKKPLYKTGDIVNVTGTVSLAGNEPFTRMVLRLPDRKEAFFLPGNFKKDKRSLIGKTITAAGAVEVHELKSADNKYTVYEYHLITDKIEEVKIPALKQ